MRLRQLTLVAVAALSLMACGKKEGPPAPAASTQAEATSATSTQAPANTQAAAPVAENTVGKGVFGKTCSMCHASGAGGAPKPGDKADWAPRIAQGKDTLYKHALEGFTGAKGMMPPRGGGAALKDDEVKAAVDYMADQSH